MPVVSHTHFGKEECCVEKVLRRELEATTRRTENRRRSCSNDDVASLY